MDWNDIAKTALTVAVPGASGFFGAFFRFTQRLKKSEEDAAEAKKDAAMARAEVVMLRATLDDHQEDYERDKRHRDELDDAVADARASRPDPTETLRHEVEELRKQFERLKERQARYVRNETFVAHAHAQETQWKEIARTLGRLEALTK